MPIFVNTRPLGRSIAFTKLSEQEDIQVFDLPLLQTIPCTLSDADKSLLADVVSGRYEVLIVISVEAANQALAYYKSQRISVSSINQHGSIIAVGKATQEALAQGGICASCPHASSNEGMLAMPSVARLGHKDRVVIWKGVGGRRLLHDALDAKGVSVKSVDFYERRISPVLAMDYSYLLEHLADDSEPIWVLISSEMSLNAWEYVVNLKAKSDVSAPRLVDFSYIALGDRLAGLLNSKQLAYTIVNNLHADSITHAMKHIKMNTGEHES